MTTQEIESKLEDILVSIQSIEARIDQEKPMGVDQYVHIDQIENDLSNAYWSIMVYNERIKNGRYESY